MMAAASELTRRELLHGLPALAVVASTPSVGNAANNADLRQQVLSVAHHLSGLLGKLDHGRWSVIVHPTASATSAVVFQDRAAALDAETELSAELAALLCRHGAAWSELGEVGRQTDALAIGRLSSLEEFDLLDAAIETEARLRTEICAYRPRNRIEQDTKARHLLDFVDDQLFETDQIVALLQSMREPDSSAGGVGEGVSP